MSKGTKEAEENEKLSNHDLLMDSFNEIEKSIEKEMAMIKEKLRSQEKEIQQRKHKRKRVEIAEKLLVADKKLANMQREMLEKDERNTKVLQTMEERIGEIERASIEEGDRFKLSKKSHLTSLDSVGEETEDGEY